jgi:hypothetical protein
MNNYVSHFILMLIFVCTELNQSYFVSYHLCKGIFRFAILNHKYYNKVFRNNY